ncbi:MAG: YggS family pyridoxal phosphate-dependent enzyme [Ruminococcaceae bacterium]|nr:YggS family pyridoxal phosphate-dependent enzyme [Oscillospiraceae bacterium]
MIINPLTNDFIRIPFPDRIDAIRDAIAEEAIRAGRDPSEISLMAVTKTVPPEKVNLAIEKGITLLGENRVQEMLSKYESYRAGSHIHFIGGLQTNKVKYIVGKVEMIESVDSLRLAEEIGKRSVAAGVVTDILCEINIGGEESKGGIAPFAAEELIRQMAEIPGIHLRGLMTIPPYCEDEKVVESFFDKTHALLLDIRAKNIDNIDMDVLSMGMSHDFLPAVRHGSTVLRLGRILFGERIY